MGCSFTLFELQKEGKNTEFNYKTKSQMSLNVSILKFYRVIEKRRKQVTEKIKNGENWWSVSSHLSKLPF